MGVVPYKTRATTANECALRVESTSFEPVWITDQLASVGNPLGEFKPRAPRLVDVEPGSGLVEEVELPFDPGDPFGVASQIAMEHVWLRNGPWDFPCGTA